MLFELCNKQVDINKTDIVLLLDHINCMNYDNLYTSYHTCILLILPLLYSMSCISPPALFYMEYIVAT